MSAQERRTAPAVILDTGLDDDARWLRVACVASGESVDVRSRHPGHILRALVQLSEACSCGAWWHQESVAVGREQEAA